MTQGHSILVTGGAGYIGSHTVLQLAARGERVVVLDNLSTGFRQAVRDVPLVVGDVGDRELVDRLLAEHRIDTVIHFAAHTIVPESVSDPLKYYGNNTCSDALAARLRSARGRQAFRVLLDRGGVRHSRRAASPPKTPPTAPINPYGTSKLMSEWMLRDLCAATPLRYGRLRYFNVAGSRSRRDASASRRAPPRCW